MPAGFVLPKRHEPDEPPLLKTAKIQRHLVLDATTKTSIKYNNNLIIVGAQNEAKRYYNTVRPLSMAFSISLFPNDISTLLA